MIQVNKASTTLATGGTLSLRDASGGSAFATVTANAMLFPSTATPTFTTTQAVGSSAGNSTTITAQAAGTTAVTDTLGGSLILAAGADNGITPDIVHFHAPVIFKSATTEIARFTLDGTGQTYLDFSNTVATIQSGNKIYISSRSSNGIIYDSPATASSGRHTFRVGTSSNTALTLARAVAGTQVGLYNATPVVQPARVGQLTDNSGGTASNTIAAIADAATANAVASLAAKLNAIEKALSAAGGGIGLTA